MPYQVPKSRSRIRAASDAILEETECTEAKPAPILSNAPFLWHTQVMVHQQEKWWKKLKTSSFLENGLTILSMNMH